VPGCSAAPGHCPVAKMDRSSVSVASNLQSFWVVARVPSHLGLKATKTAPATPPATLRSDDRRCNRCQPVQDGSPVNPSVTCRYKTAWRSIYGATSRLMPVVLWCWR
jgi:hypothetical protein